MVEKEEKAYCHLGCYGNLFTFVGFWTDDKVCCLKLARLSYLLPVRLAVSCGTV